MSAAFTPEEMRDIHAELYAQKWRDNYVKKMDDGLKPHKSKDELDAITYAMYMGFRDGYQYYKTQVMLEKE
jgi:predicted alpha/beta-fold hydrolase